MQIPKDVQIIIDGLNITVKSKDKEISRKFKAKDITIFLENDKLVINSKSLAMKNTIFAHVKNMITGVTKGHIRKLKALYSHFPMGLEIKQDKLIIKNFIGEKKPRMAKIMQGVTAKIKGQEIELSGVDIEKVTQTVANMIKATKIKDKDPRIFQDGIYPVEE